MPQPLLAAGLCLHDGAYLLLGALVAGDGALHLQVSGRIDDENALRHMALAGLHQQWRNQDGVG